MRACKAPEEGGGRGLATRKKSRRGRKGEERRRAPARINVPSDELLPRNGRVQFASRRRERGKGYRVLDTLFTKHLTTAIARYIYL